MAALSKIAADLDLKTLHTNCYETIHTWHPDCWLAIATAVPDGFKFCLKTYATFYFVATLITKRDPRKIDWKRLVTDIIRSSCFLTTNLILYLLFFCRIRHALGFFTVFTMGGLSSFLASFFALMVEKKSRRPALALYLVNLASETFYRQLVHHGYMFRVKYGECIPFAGGLCLFMYLYSQGRLNKSLKNFLGITHNIEPTKEIINSKKLPQAFQDFLSDLRSNYSKSDACEHENSCVSVAAETLVKNFGLGFGISSLLLLTKNLKKMFTNPVKVLKLIFAKGNLKLPIFFALMPFLFHTTRCTLNRYTDLSPQTKNITSIGVSSAAMAIQPNVTIAMYTLWKGIEAWYFDMADRGKLPYVPHGDHILYTLSTGYVLWQSALEPHAIRKGYQNFLQGLTGGRMAKFNRSLYDHWGYQSSKLFPHTPKLDTKYVTWNPMHYQPVEHP